MEGSMAMLDFCTGACNGMKSAEVEDIYHLQEQTLTRFLNLSSQKPAHDGIPPEGRCGRVCIARINSVCYIILYGKYDCNGAMTR